MANNFEDLEVWKRGCRLASDIYRAFENLRDFGFRDQVRRAAVSIPSNIAEGCERNYKQDFIRFLKIAKGSAGELRTQLYIAQKLEMIDTSVLKNLIEEVRELSRMLQGLINSLSSEH